MDLCIPFYCKFCIYNKLDDVVLYDMSYEDCCGDTYINISACSKLWYNYFNNYKHKFYINSYVKKNNIKLKIEAFDNLHLIINKYNFDGIHVIALTNDKSDITNIDNLNTYKLSLNYFSKLLHVSNVNCHILYLYWCIRVICLYNLYNLKTLYIYSNVYNLHLLHKIKIIVVTKNILTFKNFNNQIKKLNKYKIKKISKKCVTRVNNYP